jgi:hypothetical protein
MCSRLSAIAAVLAVNRATEFFEDRDYFPYVMG